VKVVQEGDPSLYDPSAGKEELERRWKEAIASALLAQKTAGKLPAGAERLFDEVLKPKVNIRALFRQTIRSGLGRMVVSDWTRPSRKNPDLPGVKRLTIPNIWALLDTSGSIGEKELSLFVGTVLEFAGQTKVHVICWDAMAYEEIKLRNRSVEPLKKKIKGGGGTVIHPALEKTLKQMRPLDMVAILSDFEILDWDEPKTQELLSKVAGRASAAVLLSTYKEVSHPRWRFLRL
jgi:predicted metal-dependent peptidase